MKKVNKLALLLGYLAAVNAPAVAGGDDPFKVTTTIREYAVGPRVEVFGGADFAQDGDLDVSSPDIPGFKTTVSAKDQLGAAAGLKIGYTWSGFDAWGSTADTGKKSVGGDFAALPSIDYEFLWTGYKFKGNGSFDGIGTQLRADVNAFVFSIDPTVKFQIGAFRPYLGVGLGGAYITADNGVVSASGLGASNLVGDSDDFCFAVQGLAGCEFFISKNWALTLDYKYLDFISPTFNGGSGQTGVLPLHYHSDSIGQHIVTAGLSYYF